MRKGSIIKALFISALFISGIFAGPVYAGVVDKVIAVVNDDVITKSELDIMVFPVYKEYAAKYQGNELMEKLNDAADGLLEKLIEETLILQQAKRENVTADKSEVDERIEKIRQKFSGEGEFEGVLEQSHITMSKLREEYKEQAIADKMMDMKVRSRISVGPSEIESYYMEHRPQFNEAEAVELWSIFVKAEADKDRDEKLKAAEGILSRLGAGEDFGKLTGEYSDSAAAAGGGYRGFVHKGDLLKSVEEKVFGLEEGGISPIISSPGGYYIFKAGKRRHSRTVTLEEATPQIISILYAQKFEARYDEWVNSLKKDAYISIR